MKKLLAGALALVLSTVQAIAGCTLPADTSSRIGRGNFFMYSVSDPTLFTGTRDYVWSSGGATLDSSVSAGFYIPGDRSPYIYSPYSTYNLAWYKANHPEWIVYRPDRKTPAYEFCDALDATCDGALYIPLAIWVPAVQSYIEGADIASAAGTGLYKSISVDNIAVANVFYRAGTCSVSIDPAVGDCAANGGTWTNRYTNAFSTTTASAIAGATTLTVANGSNFVNGQAAEVRGAGAAGGLFRDGIVSHTSTTVTLLNGITTGIASGTTVESIQYANQQLRDDWEAWLDALGTSLHTSNLCLTANMTWPSDRTGWQQVAAATGIDMIADEAAFNGHADVCTNGYLSKTGSTAENFLNDIISNGKPYIQVSANCPSIGGSREKVQYNIATNMLLKGAHSYLVPIYTAASDYAGRYEDYWWLYYLSHGAASEAATQISSLFWRRTFANAMALVNFDTVNSKTYTLAADYHTDDQMNYYSGTVITVPPMSARVLLNGATTAATILATVP